ncbi:predicted protein [Plenodomus lingam JN3]|uniref:Predicted protein n=1 Tax=Leptosphaeria maculans (strain JN3 / isolate v23.1.3 / race Av1-4-5-6-7-8) TaxID=985895 RepID=E4ZJC5_LEPMJ|nr:predicted protein [Plenodomus lingam JN3]CBX91556.1 predicted protein [Plenodomus lingam JN3]
MKGTVCGVVQASDAIHSALLPPDPDPDPETGRAPSVPPPPYPSKRHQHQQRMHAVDPPFRIQLQPYSSSTWHATSAISPFPCNASFCLWRRDKEQPPRYCTLCLYHFT